MGASVPYNNVLYITQVSPNGSTCKRVEKEIEAKMQIQGPQKHLFECIPKKSVCRADVVNQLRLIGEAGPVNGHRRR